MQHSLRSSDGSGLLAKPLDKLWCIKWWSSTLSSAFATSLKNIHYAWPGSQWNAFDQYEDFLLRFQLRSLFVYCPVYLKWHCPFPRPQWPKKIVPLLLSWLKWRERQMLSTWQYQFPRKYGFLSQSPEEAHQQISADLGGCQTGSGWHGELQSHHRTLFPPGKHTQTYTCLSCKFLFSLCSSLLCRLSQTVCRGCGCIWWGWYDKMFFIQQAEDFSSHGRCGLHPLGSTLRRLSSVSLWKTSPAPSQISVTIIKTNHSFVKRSKTCRQK